MEKEKKSLGKIIVDVVLWVFLAFAVLVTVITFSANASTNKEYPVFGDTILVSVKTDSMDGESQWGKGFKKHDLITCKILTNEEKLTLQPGDVISFYTDLDGDGTLELNTHRIIEPLQVGPKGQSYRTKGDNTPEADDNLVYFGDVEAKWTGKRIGGIGGLFLLLGSQWGFFGFVVCPMCIFFIYELVNVIIQIDHMKHGDKKENLDEEEIKRRAIEEYKAQLEKENKE